MKGLLRPALFAVVGAASTVVDFAVFLALTRWLMIDPLSSNAISYAAGSAHGYVLNGKITFGASWTHLASFRSVGRAAVSTILSLMLSTASMFILVSVVRDYEAKLITTMITFVANYSLGRYFIYAAK